MDNSLTPLDWLKRAKSNLSRGKECDNLDLREVFIEDLCFDLQQSTEKSFKALLLYKGIDFPKTHSISRLINLLKKYSIKVPDNVVDSAELTQYSVETRYPDNYRKVTKEEYEEAVELAETVYNWVKEQIKPS
ncbi:MAG: HEPN domain-containing protein [bacterium]